MPETRYDVVGIGNAIVDVLTHADDGFIQDHGLIKGAMTLIDHEAAERLHGDMGAGAGDAYAAGFLHGLTYGFPHPQCARIGGIAAAEVIGHMGGRPEASLEALIKEKLG